MVLEKETFKNKLILKGLVVFMFRNIPACEEEKAFRVRDGNQLRNLKDLHDCFEGMDENTFDHHVNEERNDFSSWVRDVLDDDKLANDLEEASGKTVMYLLVKKRLVNHAVKNVFYSK